MSISLSRPRFEGVKRFFFRHDQDGGDFLAFFRIAIGTIVLLQMLALLSDFQALYGKYGIIPADVQELMVDSYLPSLPRVVTLFEGIGMAESTTLILFQVVYFIGAIALIVGFYTRAAAILMLLLVFLMNTGANLYIYGVDQFTLSALFYLSIIPAGNFYSLDQKRSGRKSTVNLTPYRRLIQLHVCMVYFFGGFGKALGINWWNGEAIWKSIHLPGANQLLGIDFTWLAEHSYILMFIGWSVLAIETLYSVFIWIPQTRKVWLALTVGMHLGIGLLLGLYFFATMMIVWNLTAFYFDPKFADEQSHEYA